MRIGKNGKQTLNEYLTRVVLLRAVPYIIFGHHIEIKREQP